MRLFAAVVPPETAIDELAAEVQALHQLSTADRLRWTGRDGEVPDEVVPELQERLGRAAHRLEPYDLRLARGGHFGGRALWVGAEGGVSTMERLADMASAAARRAGIAMEEHRRYTPHLTIARNRTTVNLRPYVVALANFAGSEWTAGELCLVRSNLPTPGVAGERPRYEMLTAWRLGA
jgi:2'-5' RNA ligase